MFTQWSRSSVRSRLQRRDRNGFAPFSLFFSATTSRRDTQGQGTNSNRYEATVKRLKEKTEKQKPYQRVNLALSCAPPDCPVEPGIARRVCQAKRQKNDSIVKFWDVTIGQERLTSEGHSFVAMARDGSMSLEFVAKLPISRVPKLDFAPWAM
jgi:hypothetical protein